jgi:hypothetical protein
MSAQEIIEQIKSLTPTERAAVAKFIVEQDDPGIPARFKETMKDGEKGRCVDTETASTKKPTASPERSDLFRMAERAMETGISDLAANADHYLYGQNISLLAKITVCGER